MDFYLILQDIMKEKDLNIPAVARKCGLSDGTIRSMIKREQKNVTLDVAFKLYRGLNVSLERLNGEQEKSPAPEGSETDARLDRIIDIYHSLNEQGKDQLALQAEMVKSTPAFDKRSNVQTVKEA